MLDPITINIDGLAFNLAALPALKAIGLDKKIMTLAIPILGGLKELNLDVDVDFEAIARGLQEALSAMDTSAFETLIQDLLSTTVHLPKGGSPAELNKTVIDTIFQGGISTLYKLLFKVMKFNKFTPFEVVGGGNVAGLIATLKKPTLKQKRPGKQ